MKPRAEKKVDDFLAALRVFHYLQFSQEERAQVFGTRNIVRTIPVVQPRQMIHQLRQVEHALRLPADLRAVEHFTEGEYVKVVSGPLRGLEGQVRRVGNSASIVLSVDILGRAIEASVDLRDVKRLLDGR